jgi:cytochrome c-type biogenesis protein CcmH/NrfF
MGRAWALALALVALACCGVLGSRVAAEAAETPATARVNISDVEDEVMCPICGTLLELSDSPQARREKAFIAKMIAAGATKAEIKDALVDEYGSEVLALPEGSGFNLSAYLVPAIAFVVAVLALAVGVGRWRRRGGDPFGAAAPEPPPDEDSERLDADIARYDL